MAATEHHDVVVVDDGAASARRLRPGRRLAACVPSAPHRPWRARLGASGFIFGSQPVTARDSAMRWLGADPTNLDDAVRRSARSSKPASLMATSSAASGRESQPHQAVSHAWPAAFIVFSRLLPLVAKTRFTGKPLFSKRYARAAYSCGYFLTSSRSISTTP
jgi:hypothetical protein